MKLAAVIVLAFILVAVLLLLAAGVALSAVRRARLRGEEKETTGFSESETIQLSREILRAQYPRPDDGDEDQPSHSL
jgi:hypothetical protein